MKLIKCYYFILLNVINNNKNQHLSFLSEFKKKKNNKNTSKFLKISIQNINTKYNSILGYETVLLMGTKITLIISILMFIE